MTDDENVQSVSGISRVMLDIETLGLDVGASIVSIGAVSFEPLGLGEEFSASVSLESCQDAGLTIEAGTLEWWLGQDDAVREQLIGGDDLEQVLSEFVVWYGEKEPAEVWANSPSFDCEMMEFAGDAVGVEMPWEFWQERDVRTLLDLPIAADYEHDGTEHDALDDARHQARLVGETLRRLDDAAEVSD